MDVCAPGGNFIFGFDKSILRLKDINTDNLKTVFSFVKIMEFIKIRSLKWN